MLTFVKHKTETVAIDVRFLFKHAVCHSKKFSVADLSSKIYKRLL